MCRAYQTNALVWLLLQDITALLSASFPDATNIVKPLGYPCEHQLIILNLNIVYPLAMSPEGVLSRVFISYIPLISHDPLLPLLLGHT